VDVDETGGDDQPCCVDRIATVLLRERPERRDAAVRDSNVGATRRGAGSVHDAAADQDEVEARGGLALCPKARNEDADQADTD
jgi:hypothetical protein